MKGRLFFSILLCLIYSSVALGQRVTFQAGANWYNVLQWGKDDHKNFHYKGGGGYVIGLRIADFKGRNWTQFALDVALENTHGEYAYSAHGLGGGSGIDAKVHNQRLRFGLGLYRFKLFQKIDYHIGVAFSFLLNEKSTGTWYNWNLNPQGNGPSHNRDEGRLDISAKTIVYLDNQFGYTFPISEQWAIEPRYHLSIGVSSLPQYLSQWRHYLTIGLQRIF